MQNSRNWTPLRNSLPLPPWWCWWGQISHLQVKTFTWLYMPLCDDSSMMSQHGVIWIKYRCGRHHLVDVSQPDRSESWLPTIECLHEPFLQHWNDEKMRQVCCACSLWHAKKRLFLQERRRSQFTVKAIWRGWWSEWQSVSWGRFVKHKNKIAKANLVASA